MFTAEEIKILLMLGFYCHERQQYAYNRDWYDKGELCMVGDIQLSIHPFFCCQKRLYDMCWIDKNDKSHGVSFDTFDEVVAKIKELNEYFNEKLGNVK